MVCVHCGERIIASEQRFCHACGATLPHYPAPAQASTANLVTDGGERGWVEFLGRVALDWAAHHKGEVVVYSTAALVALATLTALIVTLVALLVHLAPIILFCAILVAASRHRRKRVRRVMRWQHGRWVHF